MCSDNTSRHRVSSKKREVGNSFLNRKEAPSQTDRDQQPSIAGFYMFSSAVNFGRLPKAKLSHSLNFKYKSNSAKTHDHLTNLQSQKFNCSHCTWTLTYSIASPFSTVLASDTDGVKTLSSTTVASFSVSKSPSSTTITFLSTVGY